MDRQARFKDQTQSRGVGYSSLRLQAAVGVFAVLPMAPAVASIGSLDLSQAPGGGFNTNPPGGWTAMKIFIGEGEQESEVFVNLNPAIGKGQFSIKDADYGDKVLKQLATVL